MFRKNLRERTHSESGSSTFQG